ncbi:YybH family protein [Desertivirga brevis]|uniref:YybH family protein n=1 Tax=Desertivirga brevis TaxID=2810310 RepID=UPI001A972D70|nr:nuclear transport factor 2 family protein [Pedobacter sp. SYSU D00873]
MVQNFDRTEPAGAVRYFRHCILNGNLEGALSCFDTNAVYIEQDGQEIRGLDNIQKSLEHLCSWKPSIKGSRQKFTIVGDMALWMDKWTLEAVMPNGEPVLMNGATSCLMKKNSEGLWLWLVDNPFAAEVLN